MSDETISATPSPPYYAVIFTSIRTTFDEGYAQTADEMIRLGADQPGFLGFETARDGQFGITVSYWTDLESIAKWKAVAEHRFAQRRGREVWYECYKTRIAKVERDYGFTHASHV